MLRYLFISIGGYIMSVVTITSGFRISAPEQIKTFFWKKNDIGAQIQARVARIFHFIRTGLWIDANTACEWAQQHPEQNLHTYVNDTCVYRKIIRAENQMFIPQKTLWEKICDVFTFVLEFIKHPTTVGAILPSFQNLAKEIVSQIPKDLDAIPRTICEVGPGGNGIFTDAIIRRMNAHDTLVLVEFNDTFCQQLQDRYKTLIAAGKVKVYNQSITDHTVTEKYDYIISGLPLNAFETSLVNEILVKFANIAKHGCKLSYFDYPIARDIARIFASPAEQRRIDEIKGAKDYFADQHNARQKNIYMNVPPARVVHHTM